MNMRILFILMTLMMSTSQALANVSVYLNPKLGYTLNFPDTWIAQAETSHVPHIFKIVPNEGRSEAFCQISTQAEGRYKIYGPDILPDVLKRDLNADFWLTQLADYNAINFIEVYEKSSVANAPGTRVLVDYLDQRGLPYRSWLGASVIDGTMYITQCAAIQEDFETMEKMFHSIMATLKTPNNFHPFVNGFYSDFTGDRPILFPLSNGIGTIEFN